MSTTLLAIDERWIAQVFAMRRSLCWPQTPHLETPLMAGAIAYGSVLRDNNGQWRMWYLAEPVYCEYFATSSDGLHWAKPTLDCGVVVEAGPNAIMGEGQSDGEGRRLVDTRGPEGFSVLDAQMTPHPAARERFTALYLARGEDWRGLCIAHSADGIVWQGDERNPVLPGWRDTSQALLFDPDLGEYVVYGRPYVHVSSVTECNRLISRTTSVDLAHWSPERTVLATDDLDADAWDLTDEGALRGGGPLADAKSRAAVWAEITEGDVAEVDKPVIRGRNRQWYGISPFREHGLYLAIAWLYDIPSGDTWLELLHSVDGIEWRREPDRAPWLTKPGVCLRAMSTPPVLKNDQHHIYYSHAKQNHHAVPTDCQAGLRIAMIERDRWAAYRSGEQPGELLTQVLPPHGALTLNVQFAAGGTLAAQLLSATGEVLNTGVAADSGFSAPIQWKTPYAPPSDARLRLVSNNAELYALNLT